jgi:hypothetical protein
LGAADWRTDEAAFGIKPAEVGEVRFSRDARRPIDRIVERAAAEFEPTMLSAPWASEAENDPTALGEVRRAGRSLRTPPFTLAAPGRLHYLVRGGGQARIVLGNYVLFDGPLHKNLLQRIPPTNRYRWVPSPDLSAYQGNAVHIEFTALSADFAVAAVIQSAEPPAPRRVSPLIADFLSGESSPEKLADAYQSMFMQVAKHVAEQSMGSTREPLLVARAANWMMREQTLFAEKGTSMRRTIAPVSGPALEGEKLLLERLRRPSRLALAICDGNGLDERVFIRGSPKNLGSDVPRRFLEALDGSDLHAARDSSGRLELARRMVDSGRNPFIARVIVNRVWHHLFGRGLVASVDNLGVMGEPPSHPELLDFLADRFVRDGWPLKRLVRDLVLSRTYAASSANNAATDQVDPENRLLHRMPVRRLPAEALRDSMLGIADTLNGRMFGKSVLVYLTEFQQGRGRPGRSGPLDGDRRRSIYLAVPRNFLTPFLVSFDQPTPFTTIGRRPNSNVPAQSLILLNDPFVHDQASHWGRLAFMQSGNNRDRIQAMYVAAFGRHPTTVEIELCQEFLGAADASAFEALAHVLFNAKEFAYVK